ncbi:MAG: site-specific integrase [Bacteroidota bacterium]
MASVKIALRTAERRADGTAPLYLTCRHGNARAVLSLGLTLKPKDWNDRSASVRKRHPEAERLNEHLQHVLARAQAELTRLTLDPARRVSAATLRDRVRAAIMPEPEPPAFAPGTGPEADFLAYARDVLEGYRTRGQINTFQAYRSGLLKLAAWHHRETGRTELPFQAVTPRLVRRFHAHLAAPKAEGGCGNRPNTVHKAVTSVAKLYRQAVEEGAIPYGPDPFKAVKLKKERARKRKLSLDEVRALARCTLPPGRIRDVRDWWLFAFYAGGMRFSDVAGLRREHLRITETPDGEEVRVFYRMGKTKELHGVLLVPDAVALLDQRGWRSMTPDERVFEILDGYDLSTPQGRHNAIAARNALANKYLRKIALHAGLVDAEGTPRKVGFHLSRHSLAGYLLDQGTDVHTIQRILGHSSVRVTEQYLRGFERSTADDAMRSVRL